MWIEICVRVKWLLTLQLWQRRRHPWWCWSSPMVGSCEDMRYVLNLLSSFSSIIFCPSSCPPLSYFLHSSSSVWIHVSILKTDASKLIFFDPDMFLFNLSPSQFLWIQNQYLNIFSGENVNKELEFSNRVLIQFAWGDSQDKFPWFGLDVLFLLFLFRF